VVLQQLLDKEELTQSMETMDQMEMVATTNPHWFTEAQVVEVVSGEAEPEAEILQESSVLVAEEVEVFQIQVLCLLVLLSMLLLLTLAMLTTQMGRGMALSASRQ
jgi:hypothetical protein